MHRAVGAIAVALAACGGGGGEAPARIRTAAAPAARPPVVAAPALAPAVVHAPPEDAITLVALTPDGRAALSIGDLDGGRLWPALDGSVEPVALELPSARSAALARDERGGYDIAIVDDAGGVVLERVDADGARVARTSVEPDPAVAEVVTVPRGVIARRVDQSLAWIGWDGVVRARLAAEPGDQLVGLASNGREVVAVVRAGATERPRFVTVGAGLAWGAAIAYDAAGTVAVSPSGARVAVLADAGAPSAHVAVVDARHSVELVGAPVGEAAHVGFLDDDHVLVSNAAGVRVVGVASSEVSRALDGGVQPEAFAAAGGVAVSASNADLVISTAAADAYLGYGVLVPYAIAPGSDGRTIVAASDGGLDVLGRDLAAIPARHLDFTGQRMYVAVHLDGNDWFVEGMDDKVAHAYLVDPVAGTTKEAGPPMPSVLPAAYDPTTQIIALSYGQTPRALRYDPQRHEVRPLALDPAIVHASTLLWPVSPALAGGAHLVTMSYEHGQTVTWYGDDVGAKQLAKLDVQLSFLGVDRAGRALLWDPAAHQLQLVQTGKPVGTIAFEGSSAVGDPTGTRLAQAGERGVGVYEVPSGRVVWRHDMEATGVPQWAGDGTLAVLMTTGIVRFDASGAVTAARCGWRFGLTPKPHGQAPRGRSVCQALR